MSENQQRLWERIADQRSARGVPKGICSALTPFPFWALIAAMVLFLPLALIVSFFVKRHAILIQGGELVVLDLSFWRYRVVEERSAQPLGAAAIEREGNRLGIDGATFHLEPGWAEAADQLIELNSAG